ncbi:restriction endonuclease subunit S [Rhodovulum sp. BSW8]|uniref:restriction endonuclease subunit S n=1 Tax=Rhodovulum sp. BSW8 TaxID=2259645 RepID=UPI000DE1DEEE|nr:restriction endonuclease subunit S [Rhodovulum sp. BSW8]
MSSKLKSSAATGGGAAFVPERRFPEFQDAGAWENVSLGSVASISTKKVGDKTCVPMSITSGVGLVSQMEKFGRIIAGDSYKNYLLLQKNDFAYNKSATKEYPEGFIALYTGEKLAAVPNSIFTCFRIKGEATSPKYLNYLFLGNLHGRWLRKFIEIGARAHGSLSINNTDLLALPVPVPAGPNSLKEQQKIADCLDSADALIEAQGRKVEALRAHKKGLMQQLFPQEGETQPRLRFPEFEGTGGWERSTFSELCEIKHGYAFQSEFFSNEGDYVLLTPGNFYEEGGYRDRGEKQKYFNGEIPREYVLNEGDMLIAMTEQAAGLLGSPALVPQSDKFLHNQRLGLVTKRPGVAWLNEFFFHVLNTLPVRKAIHDTASGAKVRHTSPTKIGDIVVFVPTTTDEQQRIADCLSSLDDLISAETRKLDTLAAHKKGLMQQLFPTIEEKDS